MTWIDDALWDEIQRVLPIVVVDVIPLEGTTRERVGLIQRETPHQGVRWNLVGGRVQYEETLGEAIRRELRDALGDNVRCKVDDLEQPHFVGLYGPFAKRSFSYDPRKHAVALTYALPIWGKVEIFNDEKHRREALNFDWFDPRALPPRIEWGFEQDRIAEACLRSVGMKPAFRRGRPNRVARSA